jgi:hypothetical protein
VLVGRKFPQVERAFRIEHARAVTRRAIGGVKFGAGCDLLFGETFLGANG